MLQESSFSIKFLFLEERVKFYCENVCQPPRFMSLLFDLDPSQTYGEGYRTLSDNPSRLTKLFRDLFDVFSCQKRKLLLHSTAE